MWKLTIEDDQANRTVVPLARDEYLIGRGEDNTVRLTERNISRRHARIAREAERWVVFDAGSYNGCYVNGARVSQRQDLQHGDLVQLGDYRLELVDEAVEQVQPSFDSKATVPAAPRSSMLLGQPDRLVMLVGPTPGAEFPLSTAPRNVIGRGEECDISVNHPSVSRVHAEVHSLGDGRYELVDRESANGIRVNGVELPRGLLDARDTIELGDVVFKFIPAGDVYVPGADESQQISALGGFEASPSDARGMTTGAKLLIGLGAAALLSTLIVVAVSHGDEPADVSLSAPKSEQTDASAKLLTEAKTLLDKGDAAAARARANQIPEDSNLRDTPEFRAIQASWADELLARASQTQDAAEKRNLLEEVARATAVDSIRRKRAANDLAALGGETVDVNELPSAPRAAKTNQAGAGATGTRATDPRTGDGVSEVAPTPAKVATGPATLVRKNPFDDPGAAEIPTSPDAAGTTDRSKLMQTKNQLLAKARSGAASDNDLKRLHALCRALAIRAAATDVLPANDARVESRAGEILRSKPVVAALVVALCACLLELTPALARFRLFGKRPTGAATVAVAQVAPASSVGESALALETKAPAAAPGAAVLAPAEASEARALEQAPPVPLLDPSGKALDGFFRALSRTERKVPGAVTRIAHFGDSIIVSDYVSGTLRRKLQATFGDAGHGFVLMANAWPAYFHNDVNRYATAGFNVSRIVGPYAADGLYGLGGVSFSAPPNVLSRVGTAEKGEYGRKVSSFTLYYLEQPQGGSVELSIDGGTPTELSTAGAAVVSKTHTLKVPDGEHQLSVQTKRGTSRLFGIVLEREGPGVVLDALGVQGARIRFMDKQDDQHWVDQLQLRSPDLVVYQFGANESTDGFLYSMQDYHRTMRDVLEQGKRALPSSSCLVIGAMDRAAKVGDEIVSLRVMPELLANQRRAALDAGCAFFDTWTAMGGARSMPRWVKKGLGQADLTHPTGVGAEIIGTWIYRALLQSYGKSPRPAE